MESAAIDNPTDDAATGYLCAMAVAYGHSQAAPVPVPAGLRGWGQVLPIAIWSRQHLRAHVPCHATDKSAPSVARDAPLIIPGMRSRVDGTMSAGGPAVAAIRVRFADAIAIVTFGSKVSRDEKPGEIVSPITYREPASIR